MENYGNCLNTNAMLTVMVICHGWMQSSFVNVLGDIWLRSGLNRSTGIFCEAWRTLSDTMS